jgi:hypothetical protein
MELQVGDWVRNESGEVGKVVHISRLTAFVAYPLPGQDDYISGHLVSALAKIEPIDSDTSDRT